MTKLTLDAAASTGGLPPVVLDRSSPLRFLLVEDSPSDRALVRAMLEREFPEGGIDVATRLEEAMSLVADSEYDLVLTDLGLPDAHGDAVVRAVRSACPETPVLVLTGCADDELALLTLAEGAQDYLVKGEHDAPHLAEAVRHALQRHHTHQQVRSHLTAALAMESEAAEKLRELNAAKDVFVRTASHELRTPLASIMAYAELLEDEGDLSASQTRHVSVIVRNAVRLTELIEDLLLLATYDARRGKLRQDVMDLRDVVSAVQDVASTLATPKRLEVAYDIPAEPVLVAGDAGQIERVVLNLMSNAIKFTEPAGTVTCRVTATATDALVAVSDTGIGIPAGEHKRLFDSFFRGAAAERQAIQGSGLGLHIVAAIVQEHGGDVGVDSVEGVGSTFTVRLPLRTDRRRRRPESAP